MSGPVPTDDELWRAAARERAALADDLATLTPEQWRRPSLCRGWDVEEVVAHLTAAASLGRGAWLRSMARARFRSAEHNRRQVQRHRGATPAETLERFRAVEHRTTAPSGHTPAYVGEVLIHAEDVRRPLGLAHDPDPATLAAVLRFAVARDFTVAGRTTAAGLALRADDGPFTAGEGPEVTGPTLSLLMVVAGRAAHLDDLAGDGLPLLRERLAG